MLILKVSFRNLFRQKRRTILTASSMIVGFILGAAFIGWSDGTYNQIIDTFTRNRLGHIQIHTRYYRDKPSIYKNIKELEAVKNVLRKHGKVVSWAPRIFTGGLVSVGNKTVASSIIGIDPEREKKTTKLAELIVKGRFFSPEAAKEVLIGKGVAKILNAKVNDRIDIFSLAADGSIANELYKIIGIVDLGDDISNRSSFYMHIKDAQEVFVLEGKVHEIAIVVTNLEDVNNVAEEIQKELQNENLEVAPWQVFAQSFYKAMKADREGMWIAMVVVVFIIAIGVLNTVLMSILERRREYGVLKAIGTKPSQIFKLVLSEVSLLAFFSTLIGIGLGLVVNSLLAKYGIRMPEPINYGGMEFEYLRGAVNLKCFLIPGITVIFSALFVSIFPAIKAAKTEPAKAMRMF